MKKKKQKKPFGVNACSVCIVSASLRDADGEEFALTFGEQEWGGVRFCESCLHNTLLWAQLDEERRQHLIAIFAALGQAPQVTASLAHVAEATPELKSALSRGESLNRVYRAEQEERERP